MASDQFGNQPQGDDAFWSRFGHDAASPDDTQHDLTAHDITRSDITGSEPTRSLDAGTEQTRPLPRLDDTLSSGSQQYTGAGQDAWAQHASWTGGASAAPDAVTQPGAAAQGPASTATLQAARPRRSLASLAAVAILAAGVGGGSAMAVDHHLGRTNQPTASSSTGTSSSQTVTKVVQGNSSNPDWNQTATSVSKSVVSIIVSSGQSGDEGTGVVLDNSGHIVTNNHVVSSVSGTIQVEVGSSLYKATIVGTDPSTDLAVLKVDNLPSSVQPIAMADSSKVTVGQAVMAVGNPLGLSDTVTTGIISALNRPVVTQQVSSTVSDGSTSSSNVYTNAIQTSAPINPGNSGGALVNANGELVGINSSIASLSSSSSTSSSQSGSIGLGFAIPSNQVKYIADQLIAKGSAQHAWLGISTTDGTATQGAASVQGAKVAQVQSGTPAASAGLQVGDVVTALNGTSVDSSNALVAQIRAAQVGQKVTITVIRGGSTQQLTATLGTAPATTSSQTTQQSQQGSGSGSDGSGSDGSGGSQGGSGTQGGSGSQDGQGSQNGQGTNPWVQPGH